MPTIISERDLSYQEELALEQEFQLEAAEDSFEAQTEKEDAGTSQKEEYYKQCLWDAQAYAKVCIGVFFQDKAMYCGGSVPKRLLQAPQYVSLVLNTDVMDGVDVAYQSLRRASHQVTWETDEATTVPREVKFVIAILNHCKTLDIPKVFATGLMLMYLEICEGVNVIS